VKLGIITGSPSFGGLNRVAMEQAAGLVGLGFDVDLIFLVRSQSVPAHNELIRGAAVTYLLDFPHFGSIGEGLSRSLYLMKKLSRDYELLIAHNLPAARVAFRTWKANQTPYLCCHHDSWYTFPDPLYYAFAYFHSYFKRSEMRWLSNAKAILTNSKKTAEVLRSQTGLLSSVLYPSSSLVGSIPREDVTGKRGEHFLAVHRMSSEPIFAELVSLLEKVEKLNLIIAGGTVSRRTQKVVNMFSHLNNRVKFVFNPPDKDLRRLYLTSRGLLSPSVENFNLVALEAAAMGCPVLTCKQSGIFEIFAGKYEEGFFDEGDADVLSAAVEILLSDPELAMRMGQKQYEIACNYTPKRHARELARIISTVI